MVVKYSKVKEDLEIIKLKCKTNSKDLQNISSSLDLINGNLELNAKHISSLYGKENEDISSQLLSFDKQLSINSKNILAISKSINTIIKDLDKHKNNINKLQVKIDKLKVGNISTKSLEQEVSNIFEIINSSKDKLNVINAFYVKVHSKHSKVMSDIYILKLPDTLRKNKNNIDKLSKTINELVEILDKNSKLSQDSVQISPLILSIDGLIEQFALLKSKYNTNLERFNNQKNNDDSNLDNNPSILIGFSNYQNTVDNIDKSSIKVEMQPDIDKPRSIQNNTIK